MFAVGYSPVSNGYSISSRGNNFMISQPMTPTRGRSPFVSRQFPQNYFNPLQNNVRLPSRSLYSSHQGMTLPREASPNRPLVRSNIMHAPPVNQSIQPQMLQNHHNFIQTKEFIPQNSQKTSIQDLYQKAMNRTNETLNRVKQKEARINMVLNRNHTPSHQRPFANEQKVVQASPVKVNNNSGNSMNDSKADPNSKKYIKQEMKDGFYEGESKQSKREGFGVLRDLNGNIIYTGYWVNDTFDGKGKAFNQNVETFSSEFHKDFDKVKNAWIWYEGEFKEGMFHGYGTMQLSNGDKFSGYFENNKVNGSGNYTFASGDMIVGVWSLNKLETTF